MALRTVLDAWRRLRRTEDGGPAVRIVAAGSARIIAAGSARRAQ